MINQKIEEYVKARQASGVTREDIRKALLIGGWNEKDIGEAFAAADGTRVPAAPPPPPTPRTVMSAVASSTPVQMRKKRTSPLLIFLFVVILIVGTLVYLATYTTFLNP